MDSGYQRINRLCDQFLASLPKDRYQRAILEDNRWALAVSQKHSAQHTNPDNRKYAVVGGISTRDLIAIEQTSRTDSEMLDRISRHILLGEDTISRPEPVGLSQAELNAEIERRVALEVRRHLESLMPKKAEAPAQAPEAPKPVRVSKPTKEPDTLDIRVWEERARAIGYTKPVIPRPKDPTQIDGRWLMHFRKFEESLQTS